MGKVVSFTDLQSRLANNEKSYLLLIKSGSEQSTCALLNLGTALNGQSGINGYVADVTDVRDIHSGYGIRSVPARSVTVYSTPTCLWCNTLKPGL